MVVPVIMSMMMVVIMVMMMPIIVMVVVPMVMIVIMVVMMIMVVMTVVVMGVTFQTAQTRTERIAQRTVRNVRTWCARPLAFDVVMVAFLHSTHFSLKSDHFGAVFAQYAGRRWYFAISRVAARL